MSTPNRRTLLQLDIGEVCIRRPLWNMHRTGTNIGRRVIPGAPASSDVFHLPGGAWALVPDRGELAQTANTGYHAAIINGVDVETAPGMETTKTYRKPDLPGMGAADDLIPDGVTAFLKRVSAGGLWDACQLAADAAAFPGPEEEQSLPLDRVIAGKKVYGENAGFGIVFEGMEGRVGADTILRFYFGGSAAVAPVSAKGGQFCVSIRGDGTGVLRERNAAGGWDRRYEFHWSDLHRAKDNIHFIRVIPYGRDRLAVLTSGERREGVVNLDTGLRAVFTNTGPQHPNFWQDVSTQTGHTHRRSLTGSGIIRLDIRRDYRYQITLQRNRFPETGYLTDAPFVVTRDLPGGTPMTLYVDSYTLPGTSLTGELYDATSHQRLTAGEGGGVFLSNAGQRAYYARFTFSTTDRYQTPILNGYTVDIPEEFGLALSIPQIFPSGDFGAIQGVQITGAGTTPETESAVLALNDPEDEAPILRVRGDIRSLISVQETTSGETISHLFEGRTVRSPAHLRGKPGTTYPSPDWREYPSLRMVGLWGQLAETFAQSLWDLGKRSDGSIDPFTGQVALKDRLLTDILRILFHNAGVPDDELDIPTLPYTLESSDSLATDDYLIAYGSDFSKLILTFSRDYLGRLIVRDPNAGARGMWRLLANPTPPYGPFLATFCKSDPPLVGEHFPAEAGVFGTNVALIQDGTWNSYVIPPEANDFVVYGISGQGDARGIIPQHMRNDASIYGSRLHPDYLGRIKPFSHGPDPGLQSRAAVNAYIKRLYQRGAHAEKWVEFTAPLLLIWNPLDPYQRLLRPLRINDLIYIYDQGVYYPAVVFACEPDYELSDQLQTARYEVLMLQEWPEGEFLVR